MNPSTQNMCQRTLK
jgi:hypothetical protein